MRKQALLVVLIVVLGSAPLRAQTPTPASTPSEESERVIRVWWPDALYDRENRAVVEILDDQVQAFNDANAQFDVELRLKRDDGLGSGLTTLLAAQPVAPSAIPDLLLLKRSDLVQATRNGVIRSMEDWVPDTLRADLLPRTLEVGQVDGVLYGLPYAITVQHAIYRTENFEAPPLTFAAVLESQQRFLLPGLPTANHEVNDVVVAQYLQAGGRLVDNTGVPILDQEPLLEVLQYYADGVENNVFSADVMSFSHPEDYWTRFTQTDVPLALVDSSLFLQSEELSADVDVSPLPTIDGGVLVIIDGWLWALTTADPEQQRGALAFLEWMMNAEEHADYTQALGMLPSRQRSLRIWSATDYVRALEGWIEDGIIIPAEQRNNTAAQQLQTAFVKVLNGTPYEQAADEALFALSASRNAD